MTVAHCTDRRQHPNDSNRRGSSWSRRPRSVLPAGAVVAGSRAAWLAAVAGHPDVEALRADGRRNVLAVAAWTAQRADPATMVSRPLWEALSDRTGLSVRSAARWLAWLHSRDLLATVTHGVSAAMRPAVLAGNDVVGLAAEYLLCHPRPPVPRLPAEPPTNRPDETPEESGQISVTPPRNSPSERFQDACAQAGARAQAALRAVADLADGRPTTDGRPGPGSAGRPPWPMVTAARTRTEQLALVDRLRAEDATLRDPRLSRRSLRHVLRPWLTAGWTARDVEWALNHRPDGGLWPYAFQDSRQLRNPAGFVVHRLRQWTSETGTIPPGPCSSTTPARSTTTRARSASSSTAAADPTTGDATGITPADPDRVTTYAANIRAALGWTSPRHTAALA